MQLAIKYLAVALATFLCESAIAADCNVDSPPPSITALWVNDKPISGQFIRLLHAVYLRAPKENLHSIAAQIEMQSQAALRIGIAQHRDIQERTVAAKYQLDTALGNKANDFYCTTLQELASAHALGGLYMEEVVLSKIKPSESEIDSFIRTYKNQFKGAPISETRQRVSNHLAQQRLGPPLDAEIKRLQANTTVRINPDFKLE